MEYVKDHDLNDSIVQYIYFLNLYHPDEKFLEIYFVEPD